MTLFALLGLPAFLMLAYGLLSTSRPGRPRSALREAGPIPLTEFLKGLVLGVAGGVLVAVLGRILPLSYRPLPLFLYLLAVDYLIAAALAAAAVAILSRKRSLLQTVFLVGGFYTVAGIASVLTSFGAYEPYSLFLRPALYMATVLYLPLLLRAYREWYGLKKGLIAVAVAALPFGTAGIALLQKTFHEAWAMGAGAAFLAAAAALLLYSSESPSGSRGPGG